MQHARGRNTETIPNFPVMPNPGSAPNCTKRGGLGNFFTASFRKVKVDQNEKSQHQLSTVCKLTNLHLPHRLLRSIKQML